MNESPVNRPWDYFISKPTTTWLMGLSVGLFIGVPIGYLWAGSGRGFEAASARLGEALSRPLNVRVSVANSTPQLGDGRLLGLLADTAAAAIGAAESNTKNAAEIPSVAAKEFVKGLSGKAGEKLAEGLSELISSGFKPSQDKTTDRGAVTAFFVHEIFPTVDRGTMTDSRPSRMQARIVFGINRWSLTPSADTTIGSVRDFANAHPGAIVLLTATADTLGSERGNLELAGRRSRTVRERLVSTGGIAANRMFVANLGNASLPVVTPPNTAEQQNRSVSIEVRE